MNKFITTYSEFVLNETLETHDIDLSIKNIKSELSLMRYNFSINKNSNNTFDLTLNNFNNIQNLSLIISHIDNLIIDRHGWFPTKMNILNFSGMENNIVYDENYLFKNIQYLTNVTITYEAKYDLEINIPVKLYHLSIQEFENSVLNKGLIPKSKSKLSKHLDRIFI